MVNMNKMEKSDKFISLDHYRDNLESEDRVQCANCGKAINAESVRCKFCGIHFKGIAEEFSNQKTSRSKYGLRNKIYSYIGALLLLLFIITIFMQI